jgi:hypothetical protein
VARVPTRLADSVLFVFCTCFVCAVAARYYSLFPSVIDPDESLYLIMAQHWLQGELPYKAVWDQHSVALPALFSAIQFTFPGSIIAIRLSAAVAVAATATSLYFIARLVDHRYLSSVFAAALYIAWTTRSWGLPANCELYLNALTAPVALLLLQQPKARFKDTAMQLCLGAFLLGVAWHLKHVVVVETALFFLAAFFIFSRTTNRWLAMLPLVGFFALPSVVVVWYFYVNGLVEEYFRAMVLSNLAYAGSHPGFEVILRRIPHSFIFIVTAILVSGLVILRRPDRYLVGILIWVIAACVDVALPGQYWPHYFLLILPAASVLVGHLVTSFGRRLSRHSRFSGSLIAFLSLLIAVACDPTGVYRDDLRSQGMTQDDVPRIVSARIGGKLRSNDYIFVFNYQPIVYWWTNGRLPTMHVFPGDWSQEYRHATGVEPARELERVFSFRPAFVVVTTKDLLEIGDDVIEMLNRSLSSYDLDFQVMDNRSMSEPVLVKVYRRKS